MTISIMDAWENIVKRLGDDVFVQVTVAELKYLLYTERKKGGDHLEEYATNGNSEQKEI